MALACGSVQRLCPMALSNGSAQRLCPMARRRAARVGGAPQAVRLLRRPPGPERWATGEPRPGGALGLSWLPLTWWARRGLAGVGPGSILVGKGFPRAHFVGSSRPRRMRTMNTSRKFLARGLIPPTAMFAPAAAFALASASSCVPAGEGVASTLGNIYFPVSLVVDSESSSLLVVNSDFDLQYNQGTVESINLARVRGLTRQPCASNADCGGGQACDLLPTPENSQVPSHFCVDTSGEFAGLPCGPLPERDAEARAVAPGRCAGISIEHPQDGGESLLRDVVGISAFATTGVLARGPSGKKRLFVPTRGDSALHYIDVAAGKLDCGQGATEDPDAVRPCSPDHKVGPAPEWVQALQPLPHEDDFDQTVEPLTVAPEPFELTVTEDARLLLLSHQLGGTVSAFVNDWSRPPFLIAQLTGLSPNPTGVAALPAPRLTDLVDFDYAPAFLLTTRSEARIHLLRFFDDGTLGEGGVVEQPSARPALEIAGSETLTINTVGFDSRGILVDDFERERAEQACGPSERECLEAAALVPLDVYVANRAPNSLLVGTTDSRDAPLAAGELPTFHDNIPLTAGPSRVVLGHVTTADGARERRVFVLCFDSALVYVYDPIRRRLEGSIRTGRGPHSIAFDETSAVMYVGHFTDSYIGVVSLDQRFPKTYGAVLAGLGVPTPPRASK